MYVCMYVCTYVCMYVCMHVCMHLSHTYVTWYKGSRYIPDATKPSSVNTCTHPHIITQQHSATQHSECTALQWAWEWNNNTTNASKQTMKPNTQHVQAYRHHTPSLCNKRWFLLSNINRPHVHHSNLHPTKQVRSKPTHIKTKIPIVIQRQILCMSTELRPIKRAPWRRWRQAQRTAASSLPKLGVLLHNLRFQAQALSSAWIHPQATQSSQVLRPSNIVRRRTPRCQNRPIKE